MDSSVLSATNIEKSFTQTSGALNVLKGVSLSFEQGTTHAITGASGSGKSTLLHILGGLDVPTSGHVTFDGTDINSLRRSKKERLLNQSFGFVFQFHYLLKELTVLENVMLVGLIKGEREQVCAKRAHELLDFVGLADKHDSYPGVLSGGEQQRVAIVRAIFNKPQFLLADEPTGNLDAQKAQQIVDLFVQCQQEWGMGLIICSHDKDVYSKMNSQWHLRDGLLEKAENMTTISTL